MKKLFICFIIFVLSGSTWAMTVNDHAIDFLNFSQLHGDKKDKEVVKLFKETVITNFSEFYKFKFKKWIDAGLDPDQELLAQIRGFAAISDRFKIIYKDLSKTISVSIDDFKKHFPDVSKEEKIYIVHSLGELNGGVRIIEGSKVFLMGLDVMAKHHSWDNNIPFLHHEFFHLYHMNRRPEDFKIETIWAALWKEGLATYVSKRINPNATPAELMLTIPQNLYQNCIEKKQEIANKLLEVFDSSSEEEYKRYFLMSSNDKIMPKRAGYCIGYLALAKFGDSYTLHDLAVMDFQKAKELLRASLKSI